MSNRSHWQRNRYKPAIVLDREYLERHRYRPNFGGPLSKDELAELALHLSKKSFVLVNPEVLKEEVESDG